MCLCTLGIQVPSQQVIGDTAMWGWRVQVPSEKVLGSLGVFPDHCSSTSNGFFSGFDFQRPFTAVHSQKPPWSSPLALDAELSKVVGPSDLTIRQRSASVQAAAQKAKDGEFME